MKGSRYLLRYKGPGPKPASDVKCILNTAGLVMLDESPRMILVELPESDLDALMAQLTSWIAVPERTVPLPDSRPRLGK